MARVTDRQLRQISKPGVYPAGPNLLLQVRAGATEGRLSRSWIARVSVRVAEPDGTLRTMRRSMGLGSIEDVGLAEARSMAAQARDVARTGKDPIEERDRAIARAQLDQRAAEMAAAADAASRVTFRQAVAAYKEAHRAGWRSGKHVAQWDAALTRYAFPIFGDVPVGDVDLGMVTKALDPIWSAKNETARRVRARTEAVLDWATVRGHRDPTKRNPAAWAGNLEKVYPTRGAGALKVRHHPALPFEEVGAFLTRVRMHRGDAADALQLVILTATRTGETIGAAWSEIDLDAATWTIPAERMKSGKAHRVPLSQQALEILRRRASSPNRIRPRSDLVFPGTRADKHITNVAMLRLLSRMGRDDITVHGFRSTFRDWASERTSFAREVCEACLAHAIGDKVEAAYRRGDLFEKRRRLMQAWADYAVRRTHAADVVALPIKGSGNAKRAVP